MNIHHIEASIVNRELKVTSTAFELLEYKSGEYVRFKSNGCETTHINPNLDTYLTGKIESQEPSISIWTCDSDKAEAYQSNIPYILRDLIKQKVNEMKSNIRIIDKFCKEEILNL